LFIAILTYIRPLGEVDALIAEHVAYLDRHYESGLFVASGRREPRVGGVIIISGADRARVMAVLDEDPFQRHGVASYELIEFSPSKMQAGFAAFL
jgi:uncharacterized protein YciI